MSLLMLLMLAMTLAATVTHARLSSESLHDDGGKLELIPYPICIETCKTECACTKIYPIEKAMCVCGDGDDKSNKPGPLVLQKSATMLEKYSAAGKKVSYKCCYAACDGCVCDRRPIEIAECFCLKNTTDSKSKKPAAAIQSISATKVEKFSGKIIPYYCCIDTCEGSCVCDRRIPELAECVCTSAATHSILEEVVDDALHMKAGKGKSDDDELITAATKTKLEKDSDDERIPYLECIKTCDLCACDRRPINMSMCICLNNTDSPAAIQTSLEEVELHKNLDLLANANANTNANAHQVGKSGDFIPYPECIKTCDECNPCTLIWPIELALCQCINYTDSAKSKRQAAIQSISEEVEELDKKLDLLANANQAVKPGDFIPYPECIKNCDECTTCTKIYPIEEAICKCIIYVDSKSKKPAAAVQSISAEQVELSSQANSNLIPYPECIETCKTVCACTLIWPPELSMCFCAASIKSSTTKAAEDVEQLHKKLDLLANPNQAGKSGLFMPYPECIKTCDVCNPCTLIYPIELAQCVCIIYDDSSKSKKPAAIQSSGDAKQLVLWTNQEKLEAIPYDECIKTCHLCACTAIWPPEASICVCVTPKPGTGKALPI